MLFRHHFPQWCGQQCGYIHSKYIVVDLAGLFCCFYPLFGFFAISFPCCAFHHSIYLFLKSILPFKLETKLLQPLKSAHIHFDLFISKLYRQGCYAGSTNAALMSFVFRYIIMAVIIFLGIDLQITPLLYFTDFFLPSLSLFFSKACWLDGSACGYEEQWWIIMLVLKGEPPWVASVDWLIALCVGRTAMRGHPVCHGNYHDRVCTSYDR